jgi:membrane-bound lytic murein transglycosylase D
MDRDVGCARVWAGLGLALALVLSPAGAWAADPAAPTVPATLPAQPTAPSATASAQAADAEAPADPAAAHLLPAIEGDAAAVGEDADPSLQDQVEEEETVEESAPAPDAAEGPHSVTPRHGVPVVVDPADPFPSSPIIEQQKAFWIRVFTELSSEQGLLHDGHIANPVYEKLDLSGMGRKESKRYVKHRLQALAADLRELAADVEAGRTPGERGQLLLSVLPQGTGPERIREYVRKLRFQRGLADRFKGGLIRSGAFLKEIRAILGEYEVPEDLAYLPHVESSYNNATRSRAGAAGVWQFTRGTGVLFMKVGYEVDDRLDPLVAARAAAKFLRQNYDRLGTWPLAITAYNHGPQSLERIVGRAGTADMGYLVENYEGPHFKFASKNFYAEFLAAREVATHYDRYFGRLELEPTLVYRRVELPFYLEFDRAAHLLGVTRGELAQLNPGLRPPVLTGAKYIPRGQMLRIPGDANPRQFIADVPDSARKGAQKVSTEVRVARGDTLYGIGRRHQVSWQAIAAANNLGPRARLMVGQRLILPGARGATPVALAQSGPATAQAAASLQTPARQPAKLPAQPAQPAEPVALNVEPAPELSHLAAVAARQYGHLALADYSPERKEASLRSAYGETLGHYADWAQVSAEEIRELNGLRAGTSLQPGRKVLIPLQRTDAESFSRQRMAFHQNREDAFFAEYRFTETAEVSLGRGQTAWSVAQTYNVPMWLLYRENPVLLQRAAQLGMKLKVPVLKEVAALDPAREARASP